MKTTVVSQGKYPNNCAPKISKHRPDTNDQVNLKSTSWSKTINKAQDAPRVCDIVEHHTLFVHEKYYSTTIPPPPFLINASVPV